MNRQKLENIFLSICCFGRRRCHWLNRGIEKTLSLWQFAQRKIQKHNFYKWNCPMATDFFGRTITQWNWSRENQSKCHGIKWYNHEKETMKKTRFRWPEYRTTISNFRWKFSIRFFFFLFSFVWMLAFKSDKINFRSIVDNSKSSLFDPIFLMAFNKWNRFDQFYVEKL